MRMLNNHFCDHVNGDPTCAHDWIHGVNYSVRPRSNNAQYFTAWVPMHKGEFETYRLVRNYLLGWEAANLRDYYVGIMGSGLNHFAISSNVWKTTRKSARRNKWFTGEYIVKITFVIENGTVVVTNVEKGH